jgi:hypothetical protein
MNSADEPERPTMSRIVTLSTAILMTIAGTGVVLSETVGNFGREPRQPNYDMSTEAGIRAQAYRIFPWGRQSQQRELWIADRMSEQLDRQAGNSYSVRVKR